MQPDIRDLLKKNRLSVTESRLQILEMFYQSPGALAHADIEKHIHNNIDRVTIYRTLQAFEEKGIIHTIPSSDSSIKYALCKEVCKDGHHHDNHVHFVCEQCNKTVCLEEIDVPSVKLPKGFKPSSLNMVVNGTCKDCD